MRFLRIEVKILIYSSWKQILSKSKTEATLNAALSIINLRLLSRLLSPYKHDSTSDIDDLFLQELNLNADRGYYKYNTETAQFM